MAHDIDSEFIIESLELLEQTEENLLQYESSKEKDECYKVILRCLHTLKGACGMFALTELEKGFHHFEDLIIKNRDVKPLKNELIDYLLTGVDKAKAAFQSDMKLKYPLIDPTEEKSQPVEQKATQAKPAARKVVQREQGRPQIYVVDDEPGVLNYIKEILTDEGIDCICFEDASKAMANLKTDHPDLIITDLQMPKMGGLDFIRETRKSFTQLPIIIVSGFVTKDACIEALCHGASGIIEKPFNPDQLISMAKINIQKYRSYKLLSRSIKYMQYQFSDLDEYLVSQGQDYLRDSLRNELQQIIIEKRRLDNPDKDL